MKLLFLFVAFGIAVIKADDDNVFPKDFLFGFSTASYQIEGAWNEDGKGENVWDRFVHSGKKRIIDSSTGDVATDSYHKYKEDVAMVKHLGADFYRLSLSWARILPNGDLSSVNRLGIDYYNNVINELLAHDIQPMVTLYHWDLPQKLQELGGWTNPLMADYYEDYADLAFKEFGDRVKWWITFNEPFEACRRAYGSPLLAPGLNMSGVADYLCAHTLLKSHARVYHLYSNEYKKNQTGRVGISLNGGYFEPLTDSEKDKAAAELAMEFEIGWFLHPLLGEDGDYPEIMRKRIDSHSKAENYRRSRLPTFSDSWKRYIHRSLDFLGVNHYTTFLVSESNDIFPVPSFQNDVGVSYTQNKSWPVGSAPWLRVEPTGFRKKMNWIKSYTNNFPVIITENGYADNGELEDVDRINYHKEYLKELLKAINEDGCNIFGYIAWSLLDNFEWILGYTARFGVYHVDFENPDRPRTPKASVTFFKNLIETKSLESPTM